MRGFFKTEIASLASSSALRYQFFTLTLTRQKQPNMQREERILIFNLVIGLFARRLYQIGQRLTTNPFKREKPEKQSHALEKQFLTADAKKDFCIFYLIVTVSLKNWNI